MGIVITIASTIICGGVGGFVGFIIAKKKYEKLITKEVEAVEAYYKKQETEKKPSCKKNDSIKSTKSIPTDKSSINLSDMKKDTIKNYGAYFKDYSGEQVPAKFDPTKPYVIDVDDYANSEYDTRSLYLFEDGILTDDDNNVIEDIAGITGYDAVNNLINNTAIDSVYVRNDRYKVDYEILRENRRFKEASPFRTSVIHSEDDDK